MAVLRKQEVTWGEELLLAYRRGREVHRYSWLKLAERVSQVTPVHHMTLQRLADLEVEPATASKRQLAYLTILAMGFDPADFGLTDADVSPAWHMPTVRKLLLPTSSRRSGDKSVRFTGPAGQMASPEPVLQAA